MSLIWISLGIFILSALVRKFLNEQGFVFNFFGAVLLGLLLGQTAVLLWFIGCFTGLIEVWDVFTPFIIGMCIAAICHIITIVRTIVLWVKG